MFKAIARFVLRREFRQMHADARFQQQMLSQWKFSARVWEQYARAFVPESAPSFDEWLMRAVPKPARPDFGKEHLT